MQITATTEEMVQLLIDEVDALREAVAIVYQAFDYLGMLDRKAMEEMIEERGRRYSTDGELHRGYVVLLDRLRSYPTEKEHKANAGLRLAVDNSKDQD